MHLANAGSEARTLYQRGAMKSPSDAEHWRDRGHNLFLQHYVRVTSGCGVDAIAAGAGTLGAIDKLLSDFGKAVVDNVAALAEGNDRSRRTAFARGVHGETLHCTGRSDALVACYPGSRAGYGAHLDNEVGSRDGRVDYGRCFAFVYYLNNSNWDPIKDGGCLRIYAPVDDDKAEAAAAPQLGAFDVNPVGGRIAIFRADAIVHAVRPAHRERVAMTCWWYGGSKEHAKRAERGEEMLDMASPIGQERLRAGRMERRQ